MPIVETLFVNSRNLVCNCPGLTRIWTFRRPSANPKRLSESGIAYKRRQWASFNIFSVLATLVSFSYNS